MRVRWLLEPTVRAMHEDAIRHYGGVAGLRDEGGLRSALARPRNIAVYDKQASIGRLVAAYAWGILRNHPFVDGNKRTGLLCLLVFLERNGYEWEASEAEETVMILRAATGEMAEAAWIHWVESKSVRK